MGSGFFALLDDIAAIMDDVAAMSKIATKKTAGILGDDLAVNAEKASLFRIPVCFMLEKHRKRSGKNRQYLAGSRQRHSHGNSGADALMPCNDQNGRNN